MDKAALLPEIAKIKIKHPRAEDFRAKFTRQEDCFGVSYDDKNEDCARCVLKVEYEGIEMTVRECCKKFMTLPLNQSKGESMSEEKKEAAAAAEAAPAAQSEAPAAPAEKKEPAAAPAEKKVAEKKAAAKKAPAEKKAPAKKAPAEKKAPKEKKPPKEKKVKDPNALGKREVIIMGILKGRVSITQTELVEKMGIRGSTTNIALRKMLDKGIIQREEEGRGFKYSVKK